jgi:hypothetical protein
MERITKIHLLGANTIPLAIAIREKTSFEFLFGKRNSTLPDYKPSPIKFLYLNNFE